MQSVWRLLQEAKRQVAHADFGGRRICSHGALIPGIQPPAMERFMTPPETCNCALIIHPSIYSHATTSRRRWVIHVAIEDT